MLVHLCGPAHRVNSELYSAALSRDQAAIIFRLAAKMVRLHPDLAENVVIRDTQKQLYCPGLGTLYGALSADASTNFGLSPVFILFDELGQVKGSRHPLYEALETATGAQGNPLTLIISTQAPTDADLLSVLIDDAKQENDPRTRLFLYTAPEGDDPFTEETIRKANPAFGDFMNAKEVMDMAESARRMPSREAEYRNLILNQRVEASSPFVSKAVWQSNGGDPVAWGPVYAGLDLSEVNDLTAFVMVAPVAKTFSVRPVFWLPGDNLEERARKDRVPYDLWAKDGHLQTTPGKSIQYEWVAQEIAKAFSEHDVRKVAFDRYGMRHLKPWLLKAGLSEAMIDERFVDFGQGFVSMSPAVRVLESALLDGALRHGNHPVLTMNAANAVVRRDEAGNQKLDKRRSRGRIDGMVGLAMAMAMASENSNRAPVFAGVDLSRITEDMKT